MNQDQMCVQCWPAEQAAISATTTVTDMCQVRIGGVVLTLSESQTTRLIDTLRGPLAEIRRRALHKSALPTDTADDVAEVIRTLNAVRAPLESAAQLDWDDQHPSVRHRAARLEEYRVRFQGGDGA